MKRPDHIKAPDYLAKSPPVPKPGLVEPTYPDGEEGKANPTRYGDWEKKGVAVDF